jgi:LAGLIDADG endonuclease
MTKDNLSRDQLSKSLDRRIRHLMIRTLERFEDSFEDLNNTREGQVYKSDLRNMFNDVLRAQRDELLDYEIEYRPLRLTEDNTLAITQTFMQSVQKVEFGFKDSGKPHFSIYAASDKSKVLDALRAELGCGILYFNNNNVILNVVGISDCIISVIPLMDKYRLHVDVRKEYINWRQQVVDIYTENKEIGS